MKKLFCLCSFFSVSMCIVYLFPSCAATITVTGIYPNSDSLILKDSQGNPATVFEVDAGKSVKWKIDKGSGVSSIKAIEKKGNSDNVFKKEPHKKCWSRSWKGTVQHVDGLIGKDTAGGYYKEDYYIEWKDNNDSTRTYDPRIQVKSR